MKNKAEGKDKEKITVETLRDEIVRIPDGYE